MKRRLCATLVAALACATAVRLAAQDVVLVPGTISGTLWTPDMTMQQVNVYASPVEGGEPSSVSIYPNAVSGSYSLTVSVPQTGSATFNAAAAIWTDGGRDYLTTPVSQVAVSSDTPGGLDFSLASVGFINASISVAGGTLQSAYVSASKQTSWTASTSATPAAGLLFPIFPGTGFTVNGTAYLTDGRQVPLPPRTVDVAAGQTVNVWFSVAAPTSAISGTIALDGPAAVQRYFVYASGPSYRWTEQRPPAPDQIYLLDGLASGSYSLGAVAYLNEADYVAFPDSAFSPRRRVDVGTAGATVNISAKQAFIDSTLTLSGALNLSPYLYSGQLRGDGVSPSAAAGGSAADRWNMATRAFNLVVTEGTWKLGYLNVNYYRPSPYFWGGFNFYDRRSESLMLEAGETRRQDMNLALGEVTIAMSVVGGGRFSNPRIHTGSCSYADAQGAPQWSYDVFASSGVSDVTQGEISFAGPAGTCTITPMMTVSGSNVVLSPMTVTVVPGTSQVIDVGGPTLTIAAPVAGSIVSTDTITVSGNATDDVAVASVTVNGASAALTSTGNPADAEEVGFEVTVSGLHRGPNTITTLASDSSTPAKSTIDTRTVYYDTAAPALAFTPADGTSTTATSIEVSGTADDDAGIAEITVNGNPVAVTSTNNAANPNEVSFTASVPLATGANSIAVAVTDISTRTTRVTRAVTRSEQAATELAVDAASGTFGGAATLSATLTSNGTPVAGRTIRFTVGSTGVDATTAANGVATVSGVSLAGYDAGTYSGAVAASFAADTAYAGASGDATLSVTKATPTVNVAGGMFTYDGQPHAATGTVIGVGGAALGGLTFTYNGASAAPVTAGAYSVVGSFAGNTNYVAATGNATIEIAPAPLTVTVDSTSRLYGAPGPVFTGSVSGVVAGDAIAVTYYSTTASAASGAGRYPIEARLEGAALASYAVTVTPGMLTITPAPLTVKANDATKVLGAPNPAFTVSYSGFVLGEDPSVLDGTLRFITQASETSRVGTHAITPAGLTSSNYEIANLDGRLTVTYGVCELYDQSKVAKLGSTIPIKLQLCTASGENVSSSTTVVNATGLRLVSTMVTGVPEDAGQANPDGNFRYDAALAGYIFNLKTMGLGGGTWQLVFGVDSDPLEHAVVFQVK